MLKPNSNTQHLHQIQTGTHKLPCAVHKATELWRLKNQILQHYFFLYFYYVVQQAQCWWKQLKKLLYQFVQGWPHFFHKLTRLYILILCTFPDAPSLHAGALLYSCVPSTYFTHLFYSTVPSTYFTHPIHCF